LVELLVCSTDAALVTINDTTHPMVMSMRIDATTVTVTTSTRVNPLPRLDTTPDALCRADSRPVLAVAWSAGVTILSSIDITVPDLPAAA
jgi:hypothetical protein